MNKIKIVVSVFLGVLFLFGGYSCLALVQTEKSWEGGKVDVENISLVDRVTKFQNEIKKIISRVGVTKKYCNSRGCWKSDVGGMILGYEGIQGKWDSDNFGQELKFDDGKGNPWESSNNGQVLTYIDSTKINWKSDNNGQRLKFDDGKGNSWESDNNGQILKYEGIQGNWVSDNNGQNLKYNDGSKDWNSDNTGQVVDYKDKQGTEWNQADLNKK
ncbi:MAG: hypothetical protein WCK16_05205 [Candidatus Moraniibacteriota bacterium]